MRERIVVMWPHNVVFSLPGNKTLVKLRLFTQMLSLQFQFTLML